MDSSSLFQEQGAGPGDSGGKSCIPHGHFRFSILLGGPKTGENPRRAVASYRLGPLDNQRPITYNTVVDDHLWTVNGNSPKSNQYYWRQTQSPDSKHSQLRFGRQHSSSDDCLKNTPAISDLVSSPGNPSPTNFCSQSSSVLVCGYSSRSNM